MLFNSKEFLLFFPVVFILYILTKSRLLQNILLLASSIFFYACWDYRFLAVLFFSVLLDFSLGYYIHKGKTQRIKKLLLAASCIINLGILAYFKYFNFFISSMQELLLSLGFESNPTLLNVVLPVGISFYTFHGLSYVFDIYREKISPTTNFLNYSLFVVYFPLLVAGPIERATHLLPQLEKRRELQPDRMLDGFFQILWGFFKKVVVADNCATIVNSVFDNYTEYGTISLCTAALLFSIQIYCDFSGYSDIALGVSRMFGIELIRNFAFPYFSMNIDEFWKRWHLSLTSWFREYLYIPLGGSREGKYKMYRNVLIVFTLSGFWHGANWTFIFWGLLNAILLITFTMTSHLFKVRTKPLKILAVMFCFALTTLCWIFFRSPSISSSFGYIGSILSFDFMKGVSIDHYFIFPLIFVMFFIEFLSRKMSHGLSVLNLKPFYVQIICSVLIGSLISLFAPVSIFDFIYFQF